MDSGFEIGWQKHVRWLFKRVKSRLCSFKLRPSRVSRSFILCRLHAPEQAVLAKFFLFFYFLCHGCWDTNHQKCCLLLVFIDLNSLWLIKKNSTHPWKNNLVMFEDLWYDRWSPGVRILAVKAGSLTVNTETSLSSNETSDCWAEMKQAHAHWLH